MGTKVRLQVKWKQKHKLQGKWELEGNVEESRN